MRRITLMLAALAAVAAIGTPAAMAGGYQGGHHGGYQGGHHGGRGPVNYGYRGGHHGHGGSCYAGNRGWYGGGPAVGYGAPVYPYAYPAPGFGVATRNFSFWLGQ